VFKNADGTYTYPQNAWAQYAAGYNYNAAAGAAPGGTNTSGTTSANTGTSGTTTEKSAVASK